MIFNTLIYFFVFLAKVGGHHVKKIQNYDTLDEKFDSILDNFQAQWIKKESLLSEQLNSIDRNHVSKRDLPFIYQSPPSVACDQASSTSIVSGARAVDFASFALGILTLVININNNINNNNNNNNNINLNAADSSNIVANFNTNNANQVNIMPPGKRKKRSLTKSTALVIMAALQILLNDDDEHSPDLKTNLMEKLKHISSGNTTQDAITRAIFERLGSDCFGSSNCNVTLKKSS